MFTYSIEIDREVFQMIIFFKLLQGTCGSLYLDLCKAFNSLAFDILLHNMERGGMRTLTLKNFQSYIVNRQKYTTIDYIIIYLFSTLFTYVILSLTKKDLTN